jgi:hypothetical protein
VAGGFTPPSWKTLRGELPLATSYTLNWVCILDEDENNSSGSTVS